VLLDVYFSKNFVGELFITFVIIREDSERFSHNLKCYQSHHPRDGVVVCRRTGNASDWSENIISSQNNVSILRTDDRDSSSQPWAVLNFLWHWVIKNYTRCKTKSMEPGHGDKPHFLR